MNGLNIILIGPSSSGLSDLLSTLCDANQSNTDLPDRAHETDSTTCFQRSLCIDKNNKLNFFCINELENPSIQMDQFSKKILGFILLMDNNASNPIEDLERYYHMIHSHLKTSALVVGVSNLADNRLLKLTDYSRCLRELNNPAAALSFNNHNAQNLSTLVQALLYSVDPGLEC